MPAPEHAKYAHVDTSLINPRAVQLVEAFKEALTGLVDNHGLTFEDFWAAADLIQQLHDKTGAHLSIAAMPLFSEVFQDRASGYTPSDEVESPTYLPGSPLITNPGTLPMRPDEPGVPLVASGYIRNGDGEPLAGAELTIYHASNDGIYAGIWGDGQPEYNLRARQLTDADGHYEFTTITPAPYSNVLVEGLEDIVSAAARLGRSVYRPAHIHYEITHPDLVKRFRGEVYFTGDPVIPVDFVGPKLADPILQADTVLHDDPDDIAAHALDRPYNTAAYDFVLKTKNETN